MTSANRLDALDVATGIVFGAPRRAPRLPRGLPDPVAALEAAVLPSLRRDPCLVSFSGGRDSSAVLALAARVARREGLPDPIPATNRMRGAALADETAWQELVVGHLRLTDWLRLEWDDELDAVGPIARRVLAQHGLLWPFNAFFHQPLLAAAGGGSLLTGVGGDELFMACCRPTLESPPLRRAARAAFARTPYGLRRRALSRRRPCELPWLTAAGVRAATAAAAAQRAGEPLAPRARLEWARAQRYLAVGTESLDRLAAAEGAAIAHPLLDAGVWSALPAHGYASRGEGMRRLFGDLLPPAVLARPDKACFDEIFCGPHARAAAAEYDGAGAPPDLVDAAALRRHWAAGSPRPQSLLLLQAASLCKTGHPASRHSQGIDDNAV